jgi:adenosylhomocysteine nucleosidase
VKSLIVIPILEEMEAFLRAGSEHRLEALDTTIGRLEAIQFPELGITLVQGGLGKVQFAIQTQHALDVSQDWDAVLCVGAAGALTDTLKVGDVVVATETVEHDIHNRFGPPLLPRFRGTPALLESLKNSICPRTAFNLHFGPIASGDEDVVSLDRQEELRQRIGALAVAWEGAGGARACQFSKVPFVEIRGVTDNANGSAAMDFDTNLERAMKNVASLIITWLRVYRPEPTI